MSLFGLDKVEGIQKAKDTVGGFTAKPSDVYKATVECIYTTQAGSGAKGLILEAQLEDGSKYVERMYFTSGTAKGGLHYTERNGVKNYLPGFNFSNAFIRLLKGKDIFDLTKDDVEPIFVKQKVKGKEENVEVMGLTGVKGKTVYLGIQRVIENGSKNVGTQEKPKWVTSNDKRTNNAIDAIFNENKLTANEFEVNPEAEPEFIEEWLKANKGKDRDKFKEVEGAPAGGSAGGAASTGGAGKSLFG